MLYRKTWFIDCNNICHTSWNWTEWDQIRSEWNYTWTKQNKKSETEKKECSRSANKKRLVFVFMCLFGFISKSFNLNESTAKKSRNDQKGLPYMIWSVVCVYSLSHVIGNIQTFYQTPSSISFYYSLFAMLWYDVLSPNECCHIT